MLYTFRSKTLLRNVYMNDLILGCFIRCVTRLFLRINCGNFLTHCHMLLAAKMFFFVSLNIASKKTHAVKLGQVHVETCLRVSLEIKLYISHDLPHEQVRRLNFCEQNARFLRFK